MSVKDFDEAIAYHETAARKHEAQGDALEAQASKAKVAELKQLKADV